MSGKAKKLWRVCTTVLVALAVALAALLALVRLFGLTPYCVLSGSMGPAYPTGALLYVRTCAASDVQVGAMRLTVTVQSLVRGYAVQPAFRQVRVTVQVYGARSDQR